MLAIQTFFGDAVASELVLQKLPAKYPVCESAMTHRFFVIDRPYLRLGQKCVLRY